MLAKRVHHCWTVAVYVYWCIPGFRHRNNLLYKSWCFGSSVAAFIRVLLFSLWWRQWHCYRNIRICISVSESRDTSVYIHVYVGMVVQNVVWNDTVHSLFVYLNCPVLQLLVWTLIVSHYIHWAASKYVLHSPLALIFQWMHVKAQSYSCVVAGFMT